MITFKLLNHDNLHLLTTWLNQPHVNEWYGEEKTWNDDMVDQKYGNRISTDQNIHCYMSYHKGIPFGYIQWFPLSHHLPSGVTEEHPLLSEFDKAKSAGFDCFIGEESFIGKGFGVTMITTFCDEYIAPTYNYVVVDPHIDNIKAIKTFYQSGFSYYDTKNKHQHCLMVKSYE
jgi:aminoglycoside 6'-N-acetyltransferase